MASAGFSAFSHDGQYLAYCGNDGKLKIWETATNRLKQEYIPNLHLSSPCSVLDWIYVSTRSTSTSLSPWKKRRRKSVSADSDQKGIVAMGSMSGKITLYDVSSASVSAELEKGHSATVTALTWSEGTGLFTAAKDHQIIEWNIQAGEVKSKWKSGKAKVTALAVVLDGKSLISAERIIKWWDLATKEIIRTFTGHATHVTSLNAVKINNSTNYLISGAYSDGYLSVWALDEHKNDKSPIATLAMQEDSVSTSVLVQESRVMIAAITRSGQACLFKYQPNGQSKPLKPALTITIASDSSKKESVQQLPILTAKLSEDEKLLLAYGTYLNPSFEKIEPDFSDKIQCLVRSSHRKSREKKEELISKVKATAIEDDVEYLTPGTASVTSKRSKDSSSGSQLLLKDRLENLSLNSEVHATGKTPTKGTNMAQLLMQGLNSKDKTILTTVLFTKNENVIRNTLTKLPVQAITPLLKELSIMLQGKIYPSKIALMWLHTLISVHAAYFLSCPDVAETFNPILNLIDAKLMLLPDISKLKGRLSLVTGQISQKNMKQEEEDIEESLLVYQDQDSSDEEAGIDNEDSSSESDENWEEMSDQDVHDDQNDQDIQSIKSEDNDSICS